MLGDYGGMSRKPQGQEVSESDILNAAKKVFTIYGYERTNLNDIAAELNITRTPIYYYFSNKLKLYEEVTRRHMLGKQEQYTKLFASDLPFFDKVHKDLLLSSHLRLSEHNLFLGIETNPRLAGVKEFQDKVLHDIHIMKTGNIRKAVEDRVLRPDTDVEQFMVYFYVISLGIEAVDKQVEYDMTEDRIDKVIDTVMDGIIHRYRAM